MVCGVTVALKVLLVWSIDRFPCQMLFSGTKSFFCFHGRGGSLLLTKDKCPLVWRFLAAKYRGASSRAGNYYLSPREGDKWFSQTQPGARSLQALPLEMVQVLCTACPSKKMPARPRSSIWFCWQKETGSVMDTDAQLHPEACLVMIH